MSFVETAWKNASQDRTRQINCNGQYKKARGCKKSLVTLAETEKEP